MADALTETEHDDAAHQHALSVLLDIGTTLALVLKTDESPILARADAFERIARAVRRTIVLSRHIADAIPARAAAETKRVLARKQVIRVVADTIERNARRADLEALRCELLERVDAPEFADDLAHRDPEHVIAELCRDLGVASLSNGRPPLRRTPDDIAILCAQAAATPGSGLPQWLAAAAPQAAANDAANGTKAARLKEN